MRQMSCLNSLLDLGSHRLVEHPEQSPELGAIQIDLGIVAGSNWRQQTLDSLERLMAIVNKHDGIARIGSESLE